MNHIMLDLETMGTGNNAAIVAIGAVAFDPSDYIVRPTDPLYAFYAPVSLESSVAAGLTIDVSTILWWMKQSEEARRSTFESSCPSTLRVALGLFSFWAAPHISKTGDSFGLWGNGATFDNVVIRSAFKAVDLPVPWSFRQDKCYRTLVNLLPESRRPKFEPYGTAHNALDDAIAQARHLQKVYKELGL